MTLSKEQKQELIGVFFSFIEDTDFDTAGESFSEIDIDKDEEVEAAFEYWERIQKAVKELEPQILEKLK